MKKLTHIDARGEASMVDVSAKPVMLKNFLPWPLLEDRFGVWTWNH